MSFTLLTFLLTSRQNFFLKFLRNIDNRWKSRAKFRSHSLGDRLQILNLSELTKLS